MQTLADQTFHQIANLMHTTIGLSLNETKKPLVSARLSGRMQALGIESFDDYFRLIADSEWADELQVAVDLLTTNETYFFREPQHFDVLEREVIERKLPSLSVWSAASSYGDEAYSIAMLLSDMQRQGRVTDKWSILGTDISDRVLRKAAEGIYPSDRLRNVTPQRLKRHCLYGEGESHGLVQIQDELKAHVRFGQLNLCQPIEQLGPFDVIFLRNVLIYFDPATKCEVVERVLSQLRVGGIFFVGMAEGRVRCNTPLQTLGPGAFRKTGVPET
jgi:chemotaxis protein methyltransferase CheR